MRLRVTIYISEEEYKKAIALGWAERFGELLDVEDIARLDDVDDFCSAVNYLYLDDENTVISIK